MSGINVGIDTIHVQTGVSTYEDIQSKEIPPTYSFKDLNVAIAELEKIKYHLSVLKLIEVCI